MSVQNAPTDTGDDPVAQHDDAADTAAVSAESAATGEATRASAATGNSTRASAATGNSTGASAATGNSTGASAATGDVTQPLAADPDDVVVSQTEIDGIVVTEEKVRDLTLLRRGLLGAWAAVMVLIVVFNGLPTDRNGVVLYLAIGMAIGCIGRRRVATVIIEWLPFLLVLWLYDLSRGVAGWLGMPTHWELPVRADEFVFGTTPTIWLQSHLKQPEPPLWEVVTSVVYLSYFVLPYALAAYLWVTNRHVWRRFAVAFVALYFTGLVVYILVPAAPPWAAAKCTPAEVADFPRHPDCIERPDGVVEGNLLGEVVPRHDGAASYVERISNRGWEAIGIEKAGRLMKSGQAKSNLVAAIPSLHAGLAALLLFFMWPRTKALGRSFFVFYAVAMAFTLMYTGEHYFFDVVLGWLVAGLVVLAITLVDDKILQPRYERKQRHLAEERQHEIHDGVVPVLPARTGAE